MVDTQVRGQSRSLGGGFPREVVMSCRASEPRASCSRWHQRWQTVGWLTWPCPLGPAGLWSAAFSWRGRSVMPERGTGPAHPVPGGVRPRVSAPHPPPHLHPGERHLPLLSVLHHRRRSLETVLDSCWGRGKGVGVGAMARAGQSPRVRKERGGLAPPRPLRTLGVSGCVSGVCARVRGGWGRLGESLSLESPSPSKAIRTGDSATCSGVPPVRGWAADAAEVVRAGPGVLRLSLRATWGPGGGHPGGPVPSLSPTPQSRPLCLLPGPPVLALPGG